MFYLNGHITITGSWQHTTTTDGGSADLAGANISRPPRMVEVRILQEQISADHHGWWKCGSCRSKYQPTHMVVGSAENARSNFQPTATDGCSVDLAKIPLLGTPLRHPLPYHNSDRSVDMITAYIYLPCRHLPHRLPVSLRNIVDPWT
jgi:hypothetical protein